MLKRLRSSRKQQQRDAETRFLQAARDGNLEKVVEFIRNNIDVNSKNENGLSALHLSSKEGHIEIMKELMKRGASVDSSTKKGNVPLHVASMAGQLAAVEILVEKGANINVQSEDGFTPLYMAAQENHERVVKFLLSQGANTLIKTRDGFLSLDVAMQQRNVKVVEALLEYDRSNKVALPALHVASKSNSVKVTEFLLKTGYDVNKPSTGGFSALHIACRYGNYEVCKVLIDGGADVNFKAKNDITPLHVSCKQGHSSIVELLLNSGAQPDIQTAEGLTALHCAAVNGHDQIVEALIRNGASLALKTKNGLTPLHMALQSDQIGCTRQLLRNNAPIDDMTEDNLTPLHVASHCGNLRSAQILLESGCDVTAQVKNGFTSLHVASKKNHRGIVELLLQHGADVNASTDGGVCPIHVAAFMGHLEVMKCLIQHGANKDMSTEQGMTALYLATLGNKVDIVEHLLQSGVAVDTMTVNQRTALHVASELGNTENAHQLLEHGASPNVMTLDKFQPLDLAARAGNKDVVKLLLEHGALQNGEPFCRNASTSSALTEFSMVRGELKYLKDEEDGIVTPKLKWKPLTEPVTAANTTRSRPLLQQHSRLYYTQSSIALPDSPSANFWASFLTDARGGEMTGCRHSGVRIILPPAKVSHPMGISCKLIKKEKLPHPPPVKEGEALACRALETSPAGLKFLGPVIFEVPHFASLHGQEREIVVFRSDNGKSWIEHVSPPFDDIEPTLRDILINEMQQENKCLMHIITSELPRFFVLISRIHMEQEQLSAEGGFMTSTLVPKVKISFPEDSIIRNTKVGLQAQPIPQDLAHKILDNQSLVSPILTIEPQRRKFHRSVSVTIPLPDGKVPANNVKLLCSVSGGNNPAIWEDITDLTPLAFANELVSFTTSVSGKYWLLGSPDANFSLDDIQKLYSMAITVPFLSKFVVFARRESPTEGRLRIFCMTDDRVDKTLEQQELFVEVARSDDVEVQDGTAQYIHLDGNLLPRGDNSANGQMHLNFHAFRENRLPVAVRVVDPGQEASSTMTVQREPGVQNLYSEICKLKVTLPKCEGLLLSEKGKTTSQAISLERIKEREILRADLPLKDIADLIGENWKLVADRLGITSDEVKKIQSDHDILSDQVLAMLQLWVEKNGSEANGNNLERALKDLNMDDIIISCMCNVTDVIDAEEKAAAKSYLDAGIDPLKAEIGSVKDLGSSRASSVQHNLSPDAGFEEEGLTKDYFPSPDDNADVFDENKYGYFEDALKDRRAGERFPFMDRSVSTMSTNTLTTHPSDGETIFQSVEEITDEDQTITKTEIEENEEMFGDGSCIKVKVVTTQHLRHQQGTDDILIGIEVEEEILELGPGVMLPLGEDHETETSVETFAECLPDGVWSTQKVTRTKVNMKMNDSQIEDREEAKVKSLLPKDFEEKVSVSAPPLLERPDSGVNEEEFPKEAREDAPVVEEELMEEKEVTLFKASPRMASGWIPNERSQQEREDEPAWVIDECEERKYDDSSKAYKVPLQELDICTDYDESTTGRKPLLDKHARVILKRRIHKKTVITAGCQEETVVTEDTHVEQDNDTPKELHAAIQAIIEQFVQGNSDFVTVYRVS